MNTAMKQRLESARSMGPEYAESVQRYLASIGSKGGKATSKAKAKAAKVNGKLGGRPKKATKAKKRPSSGSNAEVSDSPTK